MKGTEEFPGRLIGFKEKKPERTLEEMGNPYFLKGKHFTSMSV